MKISRGSSSFVLSETGVRSAKYDEKENFLIQYSRLGINSVRNSELIKFLRNLSYPTIYLFLYLFSLISFVPAIPQVLQRIVRD